MLTAQRQQLIKDELSSQGRVYARDLAQRFGLSEDTLRRDLRKLAAAGICQRVYGGAVAPDAGPLHQRHQHLSDEKQRLAAAAVQLITPGQTILIDAGSTNTAIARALPADMDLTLITNAPDIATIVAGRGDMRLIVLGGVFDPQTGACMGPTTRAEVASLRADLFFLGSCGVSAAQGVTAFDAETAALKQAMHAASDQVVIVATSDKLGTAAPFRVLPAADIATLVIGEDAPGAAALAALGVPCVTAL